MRPRTAPRLGAALLTLFVASSRLSPAQMAPPPDTVGDVLVPGGISAAVAAAHAEAAHADAHFLPDLIRAAYGSQPSPGTEARWPSLVTALVAHLDRASEAPETLSSTPDTLPLPLSERVWIDVVFEGRATRGTLLARILESRHAALFYYAVLSLDDDTRRWLASEPGLIKDIVAKYTGPFTVAAPGLRVAAGRVVPPGGDRAAPAWESVVGAPTAEPEAFTRALLARDRGRLAYFFGAMAPLSDQQLQSGLHLDADVDGRRSAAGRLSRAFQQIMRDSDIEANPLRRATSDPGMLLADLAVDSQGVPILPGGPAFWSQVLDGGPPGTPLPPDVSARLGHEAPADVSWLCERWSPQGAHAYRRGHLLALFASRVVKRVTPQNAADALDAVRAADVYPALAMTLERAGVRDVAVYARAARRAAQLSRIGDDASASRSLAQYQGALFVLARAARTGALPARDVDAAVAAMVAVEPSPDGEYEGRLVRWLATWLESRRLHPPDAATRATLDDALLRLLTDVRLPEAPVIDWEGSRYRVDFSSSEAVRLAALVGDDAVPYVEAAATLVDLAERAGQPRQGRRTDGAHAVTIEALSTSADWDDDIVRDLAAGARMLRSGEASRSAAPLLRLADELLARGLTQWAYAVALGEPARATVSAVEVAGRHTFGSPLHQRRKAWQVPIQTTDSRRGVHLSGSILGIDVTFASRRLTGVSSKPPPRPPTVDSRERQVLAESVALVEPASLSQADMRAIVTAVERGRRRLADVCTSDAAESLADEIRLDPARRTLLAWTAARRPEWLATFLAPIELFWLGLDGAPVPATLRAWGAPAGARLGCLCVSLDDPRPVSTLAGRWDSALLVTGFADLNLRLAELLCQLDMPASLLAPVLAAATHDLSHTAHQCDSDDRRGLEAFVRALQVEDVELYLALLTTGGPLVPVGQETSGESPPHPGGHR